MCFFIHVQILQEDNNSSNSAKVDATTNVEGEVEQLGYFLNFYLTL